MVGFSGPLETESVRASGGRVPDTKDLGDGGDLDAVQAADR
jgi:hypothetical protein